MSKLPQGWVECELKDVFDIVTGKTPSKKHPEYFGGSIPFVKPGDLDKEIFISSSEDSLTEIGFNNAPFLPENTILISCIGNLGKKAILPCNGSCNQQINAILPNKYISSKYVYYYIDKIKHWMSTNSSATTVTILNKNTFSQAPFLLPPLNEQKRIVEKIEKEFENIDKGIEYLSKTKEQIKQYRQSVLKSAFEGKLYKITEWEETTLDNVTKMVGDVDHKMPKEVKHGIPYISPKDFYGNNGIDFHNAKKISFEDYKFLSKKIYPEKNDIIFPRYGTIGVLRYVDTNEKFLVSYSCAIIKTLANKTYSKYLYYYLLSPQIKYQIQKSIRQTTQANIGIQSIKNFKIKNCCINEQQKIVEEIEKRFKIADEIEKIVDDNLEKAKQLKQSILKKAFEGRLVPQDPTDEPASKLLERIKQERKINDRK